MGYGRKCNAGYIDWILANTIVNISTRLNCKSWTNSRLPTQSQPKPKTKFEIIKKLSLLFLTIV